MKRSSFFVMLPFLACASPEERAAERALHEGEIPYRAERFEEAAQIYAQADHDARVMYDLGSALYRRGLLDSAITAFSSAAQRTSDPAHKAMAYQALGNGWATRAAEADSSARLLADRAAGITTKDLDIASKVAAIVRRDSLRQAGRSLEQLVDSALLEGAKAYKDALRQWPTDEDSRHDLALVQRRLAARVKEQKADGDAKNEQEKNKGLSEKARLLLEQADGLVEAYKFNEALQLLQNGLKSEPTLKQRQDYMNKLDVVTKAAQAQ